MALFRHKIDEDGIIRSSNAIVVVRMVIQVCTKIILFLALRVAIHQVPISINFTNPLRKTIYPQIYPEITKKLTKPKT